MLTVINGGTVVTGDGQTVILDGAVVLRDGRIVSIEQRWRPVAEAKVRIVDARDCVVMPGLINCHTHGVTPGPLFPSGAAPLDEQRWLANLDRHVLAGTTTVLSLCGLATMDDVSTADRRHVVKVRGATTHLPSAIAAAQLADGAGLKARHVETSVEEQLAAGAVAIGELGGGQTMGASQPSYSAALAGLSEGVAAAARYGVPAFLHTAATSAAALRTISLDYARISKSARLIASHNNHPTLSPGEATDLAIELRRAGWLIEACTFDLLYRQQLVKTRAHWDCLFSAGEHVDLLATDYGFDGVHDELIGGVDDLVRHGFRSLAAAVALATRNVARAIPAIAPDGGQPARGRVADVVVARRSDLRDVRHVFVDGVPIVTDGHLTEAARR
jgi:hypothetical protein